MIIEWGPIQYGAICDRIEACLCGKRTGSTRWWLVSARDAVANRALRPIPVKEAYHGPLRGTVGAVVIQAVVSSSCLRHVTVVLWWRFFVAGSSRRPAVRVSDSSIHAKTLSRSSLPLELTPNLVNSQSGTGPEIRHGDRKKTRRASDAVLHTTRVISTSTCAIFSCSWPWPSRSVAATADALFRADSAVARTVTKLESDFGVRLIGLPTECW